MDNSTFDRLYDCASQRDRCGTVSVEGFKSVLDQAQAMDIQRRGDMVY